MEMISILTMKTMMAFLQLRLQMQKGPNYRPVQELHWRHVKCQTEPQATGKKRLPETKGIILLSWSSLRRIYGSMTGNGGADDDSGSLDSDSDLVVKNQFLSWNYLKLFLICFRYSMEKMALLIVTLMMTMSSK